MARGHIINKVPELPLVVSDDIQSYGKTKQAIQFLKRVGGYDDCRKVKNNVTKRAGKGASRNRRWRKRKGPLIVYHKDNGLIKAFRNIRGIDLCSVQALDLLQLAPGAHVGRFIIWTESAFKELQTIWGSYDGKSTAKIFKKKELHIKCQDH